MDVLHHQIFCDQSMLRSQRVVRCDRVKTGLHHQHFWDQRITAWINEYDSRESALKHQRFRDQTW